MMSVAGGGKFITVSDDSNSQVFQSLFALVAEQGQTHFTSNYQFTFDKAYINAVSGLVDPATIVPAGQQLTFQLLVSPKLADRKTQFVVSYDDSSAGKKITTVYDIELSRNCVVYHKQPVTFTRYFYQSVFLAKDLTYWPHIGLHSKGPTTQEYTRFIIDHGPTIINNHRTEIVESRIYIRDVTYTWFVVYPAPHSPNTEPPGEDSREDTTGTTQTSSSSVITFRSTFGTCTSVEQTCTVTTSSKFTWKGTSDRSTLGGSTTVEEHIKIYQELLQRLVTVIQKSEGPIKIPVEQLNKVHHTLTRETYLLIRKWFVMVLKLELTEEVVVDEILITIIGHSIMTRSKLPFTRDAAERAKQWILSHPTGNYSQVLEWIHHILIRIECDKCQVDLTIVESVISEATLIFLAEQQLLPPISKPQFQQWWIWIENQISGFSVIGPFYSQQSYEVRLVITAVVVEIFVINVWNFVMFTAFSNYATVTTITTKLWSIFIWNTHGASIVNMVRFCLSICGTTVVISYILLILQQVYSLELEIRHVLAFCLAVTVQTTLTGWVWLSKTPFLISWAPKVTVVVLLTVTLGVSFQTLKA